MSIIEGVGDEVLYLFLVVFIIVALYVSWLSTSVSPSSFTYVVAIDNTLFNNIFGRFTGTNAEAATGIDSNRSPGIDSNPPQGNDSNDPNGPVTYETPDVEPVLTGMASEEATNDPVPQNDSVENENNGSSSPTDQSPPNESSEAAREPVERANERSSPAETPTGHMRIRLQYIDGKQRTVFARPEETIGEFKRRNFSHEIGSQSVVRFIIGGKELKNESTSLRLYNVKQDDVIHCLVSNIRPAERSSQSSSSTGRQRGTLDIGALVFPIFGLALVLIWYARIFHRGYFNGTSTFSLVAITFLYILSLLASYRVGSQNDAVGHLHQD